MYPGIYRHISLTCICCNMIEHIIALNLTKHLNKDNVLFDLQHGFREQGPAKPYLQKLIELLGELASCLSQGRQTDHIVLDFSKTFDRVTRNKLLFKLHQDEISQNNLSLKKAFLPGRSQCVALEGQMILNSGQVGDGSRCSHWNILVPLLYQRPAR